MFRTPRRAIGAPRPPHRPRRRMPLDSLRPRFEGLEDRRLLTTVDLGGIEFQSANFTSVGTTYSIDQGGTALVGLVPAAGKAFTPLAQVNLQKFGAGLSFDTADSAPAFQMYSGEIDSVVQGGPIIPVYQAADSSLQTFSVAQLLSANGLSVANDAAAPVSVAKLAFTPSAIVFANGPGGDTTRSEIQLQGTLAPPAIGNFGWGGLTLNVTGGNYVHLNAAGVSLDGASLSTSSYTLNAFGLTAAATPTVAYSHVNGDSFTFGGTVAVTSRPQTPSGNSALNGAGGTLALKVQDGGLVSLAFNLAGSVNILGVQFAADGGNGLGLSYNFSTDQFEAKGGLTTAFGDGQSSVDLNLGYANNSAAPGLVVQNGTLQQFNATVNGNLSIAGASLTTNNNSLTFSYVAASDQFELYGGSINAALTLNLANDRSISVLLGDSSNPGLLVKDGAIQSVNLGVSGQFNLAGMAVRAQDANLRFMKDSGGHDEYMLSGSLSVTGIFDASLSLGTQTQPGIVIQDHDFQLDDVSIGLGRADLGAFTIKGLEVAYARTNNDYTVSGQATLVFPAGWSVGGSFKVSNGKIDDLGLSYAANGIEGGIPIGPTGLNLVSMSGTVSNLDNPANLVVTASVGVVYGEEITILGKSAAIFAATGAVVVDKDEFKLTADAYFGAYGTAANFQSILGQGSATIDLDWGTRNYSAALDVSLFDGTFQVDASFQMDTTSNIEVSAKAMVAMPKAVPFVGGKTLGSLDFLLEYRAHGAPDGGPEGFAAGWAEVNVFGEHDFGVKYDMISKDLSVIGTSGVQNLQNAPTPGPSVYYYDYEVAVPTDPATGLIDATTGTFGVRFTPEGGTQSIAVSTDGATYIDQSQFPASGTYSISPTLNTAGQITFDAVGSSADPTQPLAPSAYYVRLSSTVRFSAVDAPTFTSSFSYPKPTIAVAVPSTAAAGGPGSVTVTFAASVAQSFRSATTASLFYDADGSGYDGSLVRGGLSLADLAAGVPFDLGGLLPGTYYLYASIDDGTNAPVLSAYSAGVTPPLPVLSGTVSDRAHNNASLSGFTVYIDGDGDGRYDSADDPSTTTQGSGYYQFGTGALAALAQGRTYNVAVVVPQGYVVDSGSQGSYSYSYNPSGNSNISFGLDELDSISGTIFDDVGQDGKLDPDDPPLAGVGVYIDANHDGQLDAGDPTATTNNAGLYKFYDVVAGVPYTVRMVVPKGSYTTAPAAGSYTVTIDPSGNGQAAGLDFGLLKYLTISGTLRGYGLRSGTLAPTTDPLAGWTVRLLSGTTVVQTTTSDASGNYSFTAGPGSYTVSEVIPAGWIQLAPATSQVQFSPVFYSLGTGPSSSAVADFDGDGKLDIAVTNPQDTGDLSVFFGNGDGTFSPNPVDTSLPTHGAMAVVALGTDYNGKLLPDLAVLTESGTVYILTNTNARAYDGFVPLAGKTFPVPTGTVPLGMIVGDFSGYGDEDLAIEYRDQGKDSGGFEIWIAATNKYYAQSLGDVTNYYSYPPATVVAPGAMATGDINGDGLMDLVLTGGAGQSNVSVVFGDGTGGANGPLIVQSLALSKVSPLSLAVGDINGDGQPDLLVVGNSPELRQEAEVEYLLNSGARFSEATGSVAPLPTQNPSFIAGTGALAALVDVNGDGLLDAEVVLDIVTTSIQQPSARLFSFINTGRNAIGSQFGAPIPSDAQNLRSNATSLGFGDFDGDGLPDAVLTDDLSDRLDVLQNRTVVTPRAVAVRLAPDQQSAGNNFIDAQSGQVSGVVYRDANRTGTRQAGEAGLAGVTVYLDLDGDGVFDPSDPSTTTNAAGAYAFSGLVPGRYAVRVLAPGYDVMTTSATGSQVVTVAAAGSNAGRDFGVDASLIASLLQQPPATIGQAIRFGVPASAAAAGRVIRYTLEPGAPAGATVDARTGIVTWTPAAGQAPGTYAIGVRATDVGMPKASDVATYRVTVLPSFAAPVVPPIAGASVDEFGTLTYAVAASDPSTPPGALRFSLAAAPPGAMIDPTTGVISWVAAVRPGAYTFVVTVANAARPDLATATAFDVTVRDVAPAIAPIAATTLPAAGALSSAGSFADPGLGPWAATVDYGDGLGPIPLALAADNTFQLSHVYPNPGLYVVTIVVRDAFGGVATRGVDVLVIGPPTLDRFVIADGGPQRSIIRTLALDFLGPVSIAPGAIRLIGPGNRRINLTLLVTAAADGHTVVTISFAGPDTRDGALTNGRYRLVIRARRISDPYGRALAGGDRVLKFRRLRGDLDGDGRVDRPATLSVKHAEARPHKVAVPAGPMAHRRR